MSKGMVVNAPDGTEVVLVDVGQTVLLENELVRVWDVSLAPGEVQSWHLHHNPYVVLSIQASPGRMDWLNGSPSRYLDEYPGGAVLRPTSPVHRLTNIGDQHYCNRLVELKELGELRPTGEAVPDMGDGLRSSMDDPRSPALPDGRAPVLPNRWASVWSVLVPESSSATLPSLPVPVVAAALSDAHDSVRFHPPGDPIRITNSRPTELEYFLITLDYLRSSDE